jgi:hypothetical protein
VRKLLLKDACPELFRRTQSYFAELGRPNLANLLNETVISAQGLFGNPQSFRFVVVPLPALTPEQAKEVEFRDWENIEILWEGGYVEVQLDNFGRIELFYLSKLPQIYNQLISFDGYIGRGMEHW